MSDSPSVTDTTYDSDGTSDLSTIEEEISKQKGGKRGTSFSGQVYSDTSTDNGNSTENRLEENKLQIIKAVIKHAEVKASKMNSKAM